MGELQRRQESLLNLLRMFEFHRVRDDFAEDDQNWQQIRLLWSVLSANYDSWRTEKMSADSYNNDGPFVPKIFPPENTAFFDACLFVANWLKGHITRSATEEFQQSYHPLTRLQLICQYARFSSFGMLMFWDHDHGMYRTQLIQGVEYLCQLCRDLWGPEENTLLTGIFGAAVHPRTEDSLPTLRVNIFEIYVFLKHFELAMLAAAAMLSHYCPLPYNTSQAMVAVVLDHADKIYRMIRHSLQGVNCNELKDPMLRHIALTDQRVSRCPLADFLALSEQRLDVVSACAAQQGDWRHYWHEGSHGGYVPFGHELQVAIQFLKFRLRRNARLALGVYGSNEVGGMENALRDENIEYKVVHLNDFANGVLLVFQPTKHQAVRSGWSALDPSHGVLSTDVTIVFRGSQGLSFDDWKLNLLGIPFEGTIEYKGRVLLRQRMHLGFYYRAKYLVPRIIDVIEYYLDLSGRQFVNRSVHRLTHKVLVSICGHSQGAGEATLLAHCIAAYFSPSEQVEGAIRSLPTMSRAEVATLTDSVRKTLETSGEDADKCRRIEEFLVLFSDFVNSHLATQEAAAATLPPEERIFHGIGKLVSECQRNETLAQCTTGIGGSLVDLWRSTLYVYQDDLDATDATLARSAKIRGALEKIFHASLTKWMLPVAMLGRPVVVTTFANPGVFVDPDDLGATAMIRHVTYEVDKDLVPWVGRCLGFRHFANVKNTFAFRSVERDAAADTLMTPHLPKTYEQFVLRIASATDPYGVVCAAHNVVIEPDRPPMPPDNTCRIVAPLRWLISAVLAAVALVVALVVMPLYAIFVMTRISLPHVIPMFLRGFRAVVFSTATMGPITRPQAVIPANTAPLVTVPIPEASIESNPAQTLPALYLPLARNTSPNLLTEATDHLQVQLPPLIEESVDCEASTGAITTSLHSISAHGQSLSPIGHVDIAESKANDTPRGPQ